MTALAQRPANPVVGESVVHESADLHVTGAALYNMRSPRSARGLKPSFSQSAALGTPVWPGGGGAAIATVAGGAEAASTAAMAATLVRVRKRCKPSMVIPLNFRVPETMFTCQVRRKQGVRRRVTRQARAAGVAGFA
ncbi:MAG: hypothetical protein KA105_08340 [Caulobacter sp.]|nr:hypothetical protein [Caulobacter sp.]